MVARTEIADDGPREVTLSFVASELLARAIKWKGNRSASQSQVVRDLMDPDRVQDLLHEYRREQSSPAVIARSN